MRRLRLTQKITDCENPNVKPARILLSLGSNVGDRSKSLLEARSHLEKTTGITIQKSSRELENPALLQENQPDFLNQILIGETCHSPSDLLQIVKGIEKLMGRKQRYRWGPREIDIDILIYGSESIQTPSLIVPHPGLKDRNYLHILMNELCEPNPFNTDSNGS